MKKSCARCRAMQIRSIPVPSKSLPSFMVSSEFGKDEQPIRNSQGTSADQEESHFTLDASSDEEDSGSVPIFFCSVA